MSKFSELKKLHQEKLEELKSSKGDKRMNIKIVVRIIILLIIVTASLVYFFGEKDLKLVGEIEATVMSHTAEVSGKIMEMPVELGQHVLKGDVLAVIDSTNQDYALEQLEITLSKKKLALADIQVGLSDTENSQAENSISIAQSNYNSANAANNKASQDYNNSLILYNQGAIAKEALDSAKLKANSASNAAYAAKAQLSSATNQSSTESMRLDIAQIESQIEQAKDLLEKYTIKATSDGVVMSKSYVLGDLVSIGYDLIDIAADNEKYFVFYLPKENINSVEYNQELTITSKGEKYTGVVKYIDVKSEYTPKEMQTPANKNKDSIKIKALLSSDTSLKPGEEAEIKLTSIK